MKLIYWGTLNALSMVGISAFTSLVVISIAMSSASAEQGTLQKLVGHQHGQAQMIIASDQSGLIINLEVPTISIVGFEHTPQTEAEKTAFIKAETILTKSGGTLFSMNPEAGCILTDAAIKFEYETDEAEFSRSEETSSSQNFGASKHNINYELTQESEDQEQSIDRHSDFLVNWTFACTEISKLENIYVNLFGTFSRIDTLDVSYIGLERQDIFKLNPDQTAIDLLANN